MFSRGEAGSWDEAGVGNPIVRCYIGDDEQRWLMWYSGRSAQSPNMDAVLPGSGSAGESSLVSKGFLVQHLMNVPQQIECWTHGGQKMKAAI